MPPGLGVTPIASWLVRTVWHSLQWGINTKTDAFVHVCVICLAGFKCSLQSFGSQNASQITGSASNPAYRALLETRALEPEKGLWLGEDFLMSIVQL